MAEDNQNLFRDSGDLNINRSDKPVPHSGYHKILKTEKAWCYKKIQILEK